MVMYDITQHDTFQRLSHWMMNIREASPFVLSEQFSHCCMLEVANYCIMNCQNVFRTYRMKSGKLVLVFIFDSLSVIKPHSIKVGSIYSQKISF